MDNLIEKLRCIRCDSKLNITLYPLKAFTGMDFKTSWKGPYKLIFHHQMIRIPACQKCKDDFIMWHKYMAKLKPILACSACFLGIAALIFAMFWAVHQFNFWNPMLYWNPIIFFGVIGLCIFSLIPIRRIKAKNMENNPWKQVKLTHDEIYIKPIYYEEWVPYGEWLSALIQPTESTEEVQCSTCGNTVLKKDKFCKFCGSNFI